MKFSAGWTVTDVCDTRDYDLVGDAWKPVAGSGDPQPCDCCGKAIVIHVHVSRGVERAIVGQACARKLSGAIAAGAKAMTVRRANPMTDALLAGGEKRVDAMRISAAVAAAAEGHGTMWTALYGNIGEAGMRRMWAINAAAVARHERLVAVLAAHGVTFA